MCISHILESIVFNHQLMQLNQFLFTKKLRINYEMNDMSEVYVLNVLFVVKSTCHEY